MGNSSSKPAVVSNNGDDIARGHQEPNNARETLNAARAELLPVIDQVVRIVANGIANQFFASVKHDCSDEKRQQILPQLEAFKESETGYFLSDSNLTTPCVFFQAVLVHPKNWTPAFIAQLKTHLAALENPENSEQRNLYSEQFLENLHLITQFDTFYMQAAGENESYFFNLFDGDFISRVLDFSKLDTASHSDIRNIISLRVDFKKIGTGTKLKQLFDCKVLTVAERQEIWDANQSRLEALFPGETERNAFVKQNQGFIDPIQRLRCALSEYKSKKELLPRFFGSVTKKDVENTNPVVAQNGSSVKLTAILKAIAGDKDKAPAILEAELTKVLNIKFENSLLADALRDFGLIAPAVTVTAAAVSSPLGGSGAYSNPQSNASNASSGLAFPLFAPPVASPRGLPQGAEATASGLML